jgi:hypothetical protein
MPMKLNTEEALRTASTAILARFRNEPSFEDWKGRLAGQLISARDASRDVFISPAFQHELWNGETVAATGSGRVDVSRVVADRQVADLLWTLRNAAVPGEPQARIDFLKSSWEQLAALVEPLTNRRPRLKMYRVFASLFPSHFTTIAYARSLRQLARSLGIAEHSTRHPIELHAAVLARLADALGPAPAPPADAGVVRMALPWLLYAEHVHERGDEATSIEGAASPSERLNPLPADRRRKGLLAIAGFLPSIRSMIEFAKDGCSREDMREHIHSVHPKLGANSIGTNINALIAEWGVLKASGNELALTPRGESLLETGEAAETSDWLLTRILGFDNVLHRLQASPTSFDDLGKLLQTVNPGWTTRFAPDVLLKWVMRLGLAEVNAKDELQLTTEGQLWAARIHWTPGALPPEPAGTAKAAAPQAAARSGEQRTALRPKLDAIMAALPDDAAFPRQLIARLDAGLWHHPRRHFAVLAGLSGAGKTLLARSYGRGLWAGQPQPQSQIGTWVLPVQPGWHDPSSIFGYMSPLLEDVYVRTPALDFLLSAAGDPSRPYTLILDEMNLSHPEQYLAPLLSAMETGDPISLHTSDEEVSGVPPTIPYPANLVIIGTVNMDDTTHGLSDKVLDRACVIDFWKIDVDAFPGWGRTGLDPQDERAVQSTLKQLCECLQPVRLHFGWRTVEDVVGMVRSAVDAGAMDAAQALDHAIYGKVLTKLRGEDSQRLRKAIEDSEGVLRAARLDTSADKLSELADDLKQIGSARFWR